LASPPQHRAPYCTGRSRIRAWALSGDCRIACALACKPVALRTGASAQFDLAGDLFGPAGFARLDSNDAWLPLDHADYRSARRYPPIERPISLSFTSKLLRRRRGDRNLAALPRPAASCSGLLCRERCHPHDSRPVGECGVECIAVTVFLAFPPPPSSISDIFAGIAPKGVAAFIAAQFIGMFTAVLLSRRLGIMSFKVARFGLRFSFLVQVLLPSRHPKSRMPRKRTFI
jgi:hypothetical protein